MCKVKEKFEKNSHLLLLPKHKSPELCGWQEDVGALLPAHALSLAVAGHFPWGGGLGARFMVPGKQASLVSSSLFP